MRYSTLACGAFVLAIAGPAGADTPDPVELLKQSQKATTDLKAFSFETATYNELDPQAYASKDLKDSAPTFKANVKFERGEDASKPKFNVQGERTDETKLTYSYVSDGKSLGKYDSKENTFTSGALPEAQMMLGPGFGTASQIYWMPERFFEWYGSELKTS